MADTDKPSSAPQMPNVMRCVHFISLEREPLAAIVCKVNDDGTCNLAVFDTDGRAFLKKNVKQGSEPGTWMWPPRV